MLYKEVEYFGGVGGDVEKFQLTAVLAGRINEFPLGFADAGAAPGRAGLPIKWTGSDVGTPKPRGAFVRSHRRHAPCMQRTSPASVQQTLTRLRQTAQT